MMITRKGALDIIEEATGRRVDGTILKRWADQGRIKRVAVHSKCALYDEEEIREATKFIGKQYSSLGKATGLSVQLPSAPCCVESNA